MSDEFSLVQFLAEPVQVRVLWCVLLNVCDVCMCAYVFADS